MIASILYPEFIVRTICDIRNKVSNSKKK